MNQFKILRDKWQEILIGKYDVATCGQEVWHVIEGANKVATKWLERLNKSEDRAYLWEDKADFEGTQTQTDCYRRLLDMAKAFCMEGSKFYQDKMMLEAISSGLKFLHAKAYNTSFDPYYGNWWNWEIGTPITLGNILCLMGEYLEEEDVKTYCDVIYFFQPNPRHSGLRTFNDKVRNRVSVGGNRIDTAKVAMLLGINTRSEEQLTMARDSLSDTFKVVRPHPEEQGERRDGLYSDWSFIQHGDVPYTGTYGNVLLGGIGELVNVLSGSAWEVVDPQIDNIYQMILKTFQPIMYKGNCMECVNGRGASREDWKDNRNGHAIINSIMWFVKAAPSEYAKQYKAMIKYWITEDKIRDYIGMNNNINMIEMAKEILADERVVSRGELLGNFSYNSMDRAIHRTEKFVFALSMHSSRIRTYEDMNGENRKGFHTGDGMTYIYNGDQKEYNHDYWATVNPYKLSGTTVDVKKLADGAGYFKTAENWVSTMSFKEEYGIAGMQLNKQGVDEETRQVVDSMNMNLKAKKSYFMLENEVVALGADIKSTKSRTIETIVDTRKAKEDLTNIVLVDGVLMPEREEVSAKYTTYMYMEGNKRGSSMGYYFPGKQHIEISRYTRKASWHEVNNNCSKDIKEQNYITLAIDHGKMPKSGKYAYVLVPNATPDQMKRYAESNEIKILENSEKVQAIKYRNMIMANFWQDKISYLENIKVNTKASIIVEETSKIIEMTVCDPTKSNEGYLEIEMDSEAKEVIAQSEEIEVLELEESVRLRINLADNRGKAFTIQIRK
ncbi:MAG: polysaccharide lyase 8 family protein [Cellulosilyticaceae bacterium]